MARFQVWEDRTSLGKFCGTTILYPRLSTGSSLTVVFITDYQTEKSGFKMFYYQQHGTCNNTVRVSFECNNCQYVDATHVFCCCCFVVNLYIVDLAQSCSYSINFCLNITYYKQLFIS